MNKSFILLVGLVTFVSMAVFVSALNSMNIYMDDDDETSIVYDVEVELNEGWNLVAGLLSEDQIDSSSEIKKDDLKAIYFYSNIDKKYLLTYPKKSPEFEEYMQPKDVCGDNSCSVTERTYFESWCSSDCQTELSEDIMNHLNIIGKEKLTLMEGEIKLIGSSGFIEHNFEVYWDKTLGGDATCESRGYGNIDCVVIHQNIDREDFSSGGTEIINSPDDGNPYNDNFGKAYPISNDQKVYVSIDYDDNPNSYELTFYELAESTLKKRGGIDEIIPSFSEQFISQSNWVYSEKTGNLKYRTPILRLNKRNLREGWNFISITPDMYGTIPYGTFTLNSIKGTCDYGKVYFYFSQENPPIWGEFTDKLDLPIDDDFLGTGVIIRVSDKCNLNLGGGSVVSPPTIPN